MSLKVSFILVATDDGSGRHQAAYADSMTEIEAMLTGVLNDVTFERHLVDEENLSASVSTIRDVNMLRVAASDLIRAESWQVQGADGRWIRHRTDGPAVIGCVSSYQKPESRYFLWGINVEPEWHRKLVEDGTAESEEKTRAWFDARYYE